MINYYIKPDGTITKDYTKGYSEYLNPVRPNGTVLAKHKNLHLVETDEADKHYNKYIPIPDENGKYQPDRDAIKDDLNKTRVSEIDTRLDRIDILTIRSLRSSNLGRGNQKDTDTMTELDDEAEDLRVERFALV